MEGWECDVTPSRAHRDLLPLTLPQFPSSFPIPLFPTVALSPPAFVPPPSVNWPFVVSLTPEKQKKEKVKIECKDYMGKFSAN